MAARILIIEDDTSMLLLLQTLFGMEGFDVLCLDKTASIEQASAEIKKLKPDIILCDVYLKNLDGFDLLKSIRADDELKSIRMLMTSGLDFSHRCLQEGAQGFISKPYMPEDILRKVRQVLADTTTEN